MTPKIFPRGSKVKLGGRDPPQNFFSKSEDVGEIMQNYYGSDLRAFFINLFQFPFFEP